MNHFRATVRGFQALFPENDIRTLLVQNLKQHLNDLAKLESVFLNYKDLRQWAKWCSEFEENISALCNAIAFYRIFFTEANLRNFEVALPSDKNQNLFRKRLAGLDSSNISITEVKLFKSGQRRWSTLKVADHSEKLSFHYQEVG